MPSLCPAAAEAGGGQQSTTAQPTVTINWSARTRDVTAPSSALSAVITITAANPSGGDVKWTINRDPAPAAYGRTYTAPAPVKTGNFLVTIKFYAQPDGAGGVVAKGAQPVVIAPNHSLGAILTGGTVASVAVTPGQIIKVGSSTDLTFTAMDSSGDLIALTPGSAVFSQSGGTDKVTVSSAGHASAVAFGSTTVTATVDGIASPPVAVLGATPYAVTDLGTLPGLPQSRANKINNKGQIVGGCADVNSLQSGTAHPALWQAGTLTDLSPSVFNTGYGTAWDINDTGTIVGFADNAQTQSRDGFVLTNGAVLDTGPGGASAVNNGGQVVIGSKVWQNGASSDLPRPAGITDLTGVGINDAGDIVAVGYTPTDQTGAFERHTVLIHGAQSTDLGTFGGTSSDPSSIGQNGEVLGSVEHSALGTSTAFVWVAGKFTDLGVLPGETFGGAACINAGGTVVGGSGHGTYDNLVERAWIWRSGAMLDLNQLIPANSGWVLQAANGINDSGQIVGYGTINGQTHAFLLTPQ